mgnify:CR=1 FL=1
MLEKVDFAKKLDKEEFKEKMPELERKIAGLQRRCRELKIPVMIVFEGFDAAGKGLQIGRLIRNLDPRGFEVFPIKEETEEEQMHPFLWRFWTKTPEKGRFAIFDGSWCRKVLIECFDGKVKGFEAAEAYGAIRAFEKQLTDDKMVLIKLFLAIDQQEQKKRMKKLQKQKETAWRVEKGDLERNRRYEDYLSIAEELLRKTDSDDAPWTVIEATDERFAEVKIYRTVVAALEEAVRRAEKEILQNQELRPSETSRQTKDLHGSILAQADLSKQLERKEYKKRLEKLQKKMERLHGELYRKRIPVVLCFEGWDAAGKGGAIKRLTECMDPRGYVVHPTAAPDETEKAHHYLWRFWRSMPKDGHIAIFDRTWYGRVLVERIEGFCTEAEWKRAYQEINDMEKNLADHGVVILKFWMQIDKEEQKRRFERRQEDPEKQWKITEEDWRNREKWDQYETAVNEMLLRTSTDDAPWIVVEGNDKYYARIKVLETVVNVLEKMKI